MEQGQHDRALAADDLESLLATCVSLPTAGHDQRLVRGSDLVAAAEVGDEQDQDEDPEEDDQRPPADDVEEVRHGRSLSPLPVSWQAALPRLAAPLR